MFVCCCFFLVFFSLQTQVISLVWSHSSSQRLIGDSHCNENILSLSENLIMAQRPGSKTFGFALFCNANGKKKSQEIKLERLKCDLFFLFFSANVRVATEKMGWGGGSK